MPAPDLDLGNLIARAPALNACRGDIEKAFLLLEASFRAKGNLPPWFFIWRTHL